MTVSVGLMKSTFIPPFTGETSSIANMSLVFPSSRMTGVYTSPIRILMDMSPPYLVPPNALTVYLYSSSRPENVSLALTASELVFPCDTPHIGP